MKSSHPRDEMDSTAGLMTSAHRKDFLLEVMTRLWPSNGDLIAKRWVFDKQKYALMPRASKPTVAVPLRPKRAAAAVLRHYADNAKGAERGVLQVLATLAPLGILDIWPGQVGFSAESPDSFANFLAEQIMQEVVLCVFTSSPRSNRKPVLQLLSPEGRSIGFAKWGVNKLTDKLIFGEAQALRHIGQQNLRYLKAPDLLAAGKWAGHEYFAQSDLSGRGEVPRDALIQAMRELSSVASSTVNIADNIYVKSLFSRLAALESTRGDLLTDSVQRILAEQSGSLKIGAWHGDWTPWNMVAGGPGVMVWDWERYECGVPVGFDALHYEFQKVIAARQTPPITAARNLITNASKFLAPFDLASEQTRVIVLLYLIELGARYDTDGQQAAGARLGDLDSWLIPVLKQYVQHGAI